MPKLTSIFLLLFTTAAFSQGNVKLKRQRDSLAVSELFFSGLKEKLIGNFDASKIYYNKLLAIDKDNDAAFYELANANFRLNQLPEATQFAKAASDLKPDNKFYLQLLAEIYRESRNFEELQLTLDQLIKIDSENKAYYFDKANAQLLTNKKLEAEITYKRIEQKFGASIELSNATKRIGANSQSLSNVVKLLDSNNATSKDYLYAANSLMQKGNDSEALTILEKAASLSPESYEVKLSIADLYRKQGNSSKSFEFLRAAIELENMPLDEKVQIVGSLLSKMRDESIARNAEELANILVNNNPNNAKVLGLYGDVLFRQEKFNQALTQYENALKIDNQIFNLWEGLINTHNLLGQYAKAITIGEEALTIYPNQATLYYFLAYAQYRNSKPDEALKNLQSAISLDADDANLQAQCFVLKADILINKSDFDGAKRAFYDALKQEPDNYNILTKAAYFLALRDDDLETAATYAKKAVEARPEDPAITDTYAFVLFKQQKYGYAKKWIELTLQNNKIKNGVYLEHYGDILFQMGEQEKAIQQWQLSRDAGNNSKVLSRKINEKKYIK